jgi:hypothetical protein
MSLATPKQLVETGQGIVAGFLIDGVYICIVVEMCAERRG